MKKILNKIFNKINLLKMKHYDFQKNKNGELQIWVPFSIKNRETLINYIKGFRFAKINYYEALSQVLPEIAIDFLFDAGLIEEDTQRSDNVFEGEFFDENLDDEDEYDDDKINSIIANAYSYFSTLNIFISLSMLSSTEHSGVLPNGKIKNDMTVENANKILFNAFSQHSSIENEFIQSEDFILTNFLYFECPFCGNPHFFKTEHDIPTKNFNCPECGNIVIEYTNVNNNNFIEYNSKTLANLIKNERKISFIKA